jgi:hypothetical protein
MFACRLFLAKALPLTKALEILRPPPKALWAVTESGRSMDIISKIEVAAIGTRAENEYLEVSKMKTKFPGITSRFRGMAK